MNCVQDTILKRRSIRDYAPDQLTAEQLSTIMEAALAAPSAMNLQPWHFSVVQNQELLDSIHQAAKAQVQKNESVASPRWASDEFHIFYHAPTVIFLSTNASDNSVYGSIDCGIAVENIALSAEALGLGSVILGMPRLAFEGERADAIRAELGFPDGYDFKIAIAVGTPRSSKEAHPIGEDKVNYVR